ncbi:MAG: hypothetical protein IH946_06585 [Bacteroidetes bacterium]|nr:hypothetical protein [Bacteroidota bacterium]
MDASNIKGTTTRKSIKRTANGKQKSVSTASILNECLNYPFDSELISNGNKTARIKMTAPRVNGSNPTTPLSHST